MRSVLATLVALSAVGAGTLATPGAASASCTEAYYVCLNNEVYTETGFKAELEAIECGLEFFGCLARKV